MNKAVKASVLASVLGSALALSTSAVSAPHHGTPADPGVINKQQILYWLVKRGELASDASIAEQQAAVAAYISRRNLRGHQPIALEAKAHAKLHKHDKASHTMSLMADTDVTKTVKVMGVLVDFPDLKHDDNGLSASDTQMYYSSYPSSHYQNLLFSTSGFNGPSNQNLQSAYQYFQAASGQSFFFTGEVLDWVTASNNAAYYGGNDNGDDKAVPELVKEAVTKAVAGMSDAELATYDVEDPYDLDGDGNIDEPDGIIDHIMLFHSSIGEEAGGGKLGNDAIWSHRFFVDQQTVGYTIPGRNMKVFGYTVQPIDAGIGVCTHEFGHDLGLPDEYDINTSSEDGSPVGAWSLMSGGSWTGSIAGSQPTGFSPYARSFLQSKYKGKWVNEQQIPLSSITSSGLDVALNHAVNTEQVNQLSIDLPSSTIAFKQPFAGSYQYYSGQGHELDNRMSFTTALPTSSALTLKFQAHWNIEVDYDYMQVLVNGTSVPGNHTKVNNPYFGAVNHFITGQSSTVPGATGVDSWVELTYDLTAYAGQNVTVEFTYVTDQAVGDYGIAIDDIVIENSSAAVYQDNAETDGTMTLNGYARITNERPGEPRRYLVQLRSHQDIDAGLTSRLYEPGVLLWLENFAFADNNSSQHAGEGLIGVVDADQNLIGSNTTDVQIRDAAFSLYDQQSYFGDNHLSANPMFDDSQDYSAPTKPQAGIKLPELGLTMEVIAQATDSTTATVRFKRDGVAPADLSASFSHSANQAEVSFNAQAAGGDGNYSYQWDFGVAGATSTEMTPSYIYGSSGDYTVSLTVTDGTGTSVNSSNNVRVVIDPQVTMTANANNLVVSFAADASQGFGDLNYLWNFGDGNSSTQASASHTYAAAGSYNVSVVVTDELGNTASASQTVTVSAATTTDPDPQPTTGGDSGGGSLGWFGLVALTALALRRKARMS
ncbi:M6 family metalloprotease domain-containing protein [Shewanella sp. WXL01]|uniref:immune inhibitor A domain-containing protein n=1 Tax=Shewanella sp. WXL01 TaxID=2709721 RepID=UPI001438582C|nr:immune inhibitor A domain-containing protein [Shewanella sp. WXL01]NKF52551.1 M6 family metalloprotease domain-containing protein [Shewanella sp. WXL01]